MKDSSRVIAILTDIPVGSRSKFPNNNIHWKLQKSISRHVGIWVAILPSTSETRRTEKSLSYYVCRGHKHLKDSTGTAIIRMVIFLPKPTVFSPKQCKKAATEYLLILPIREKIGMRQKILFGSYSAWPFKIACILIWNFLDLHKLIYLS